MKVLILCGGKGSRLAGASGDLPKPVVPIGGRPILVQHVEGDIRDLQHFSHIWRQARPDVVFHLAAQAIVRTSYRDPLNTISTNALGTAHVLELARQSTEAVRLVLVTSDKCYEGDWSADRIAPDVIRSLLAKRPIDVRNPTAVRPWQHVLEPLSGYLLLACRLLDVDPGVRSRAADSWNFGPTIENTRTVQQLVSSLVSQWGSGEWVDKSTPRQPHEAGLLRLDISKAVRDLQWSPRWHFDTAIAQTVDWYRAHNAGADMRAVCERQIADYEEAL